MQTMIKIPIPPSVHVVRPGYLRHHVVLNDKQGLFLESMKRFNDVSDVTDAEFEAFKVKTSGALSSLNVEVYPWQQAMLESFRNPPRSITASETLGKSNFKVIL